MARTTCACGVLPKSIEVENGGAEARPVSMLEAIVAEEPLREDAWALLLRALLHAGRAAEAVRAASRCRRALAEIGLEPGPALIAAEAVALEDRTSAGTPLGAAAGD